MSLNAKIIKAKKRLDKLEIQGKNAQNDEEYAYLQDFIHLYFDSFHDTSEAEGFIVNNFWQNAYTNYADGGYITNDLSIRKIRMPYELFKMKKMIKKHVSLFNSACELGCGEGETSRFLSKFFTHVDAIDLSKEQIEKNKRAKNPKNLKFICKNALNFSKKYDFVFASDMFMYTDKTQLKAMFSKLLALINKGGILLIRESVKVHGSEDYKSKNYVAYYRNFKFYQKGIFKNNFVKKYRNFGYNAYNLDKYFSLFGKKQKEKLAKNPKSMKNIVKTYVSPFERTAYFYLYKKNYA